jgi:hypothetical protein
MSHMIGGQQGYTTTRKPLQTTRSASCHVCTRYPPGPLQQDPEVVLTTRHPREWEWEFGPLLSGEAALEAREALWSLFCQHLAFFRFAAGKTVDPVVHDEHQP